MNVERTIAKAKPRTAAPKDTYIPKPIVTRPGSQDFLACPSRRGSQLVEHRLPISMAGGES